MAEIGAHKDGFASLITFSSVTKRLERIEKSARSKKKGLLKAYFQKWEELRQKYIAENSNSTASVYQILRLFVPSADTERDAYGIRTNTLGKLYTKALAISEKSEDARKLTYQKQAHCNTSDFGNIVYEVMTHWAKSEGDLSVAEVNDFLDFISEHFRCNARQQIQEKFCGMLRSMSALDLKWLTRIILKKMKLDFGPNNILQVFHADAATALEKCGNLRHLCEMIENGEPIDTDDIIQPFHLLGSMLCEKMRLSRLPGLLDANEYYLETKMDGERCQIHIDGDRYQYFSRNGTDFTEKYGCDSRSGNFTPMLARLLGSHIQSIILDGEMMVWNREEQSFQRHGEFINARGLAVNNITQNPCFCVYDILFYNGEALLNKPYSERINKLHRIIEETPGHLVFCKREKVRDSAHILECLNKAIDDCEEGVVIKKIDSVYKPGKRDGGGWFKIKPDYADGIVNDLDLLIIGGFYNKRKSHITRYLAGIRVIDDFNPNGDVFHSVCRIYSGLSWPDIQSINGKLDPHWQPVHKTAKKVGEEPTCIKWNNYPPDVWIEPSKSIVLQVRAHDLHETSTYKTKYTLTFPRVEKIRNDKSWSDCCTLKEFEGYCQNNQPLDTNCNEIGNAQTVAGAKVQKIYKRHYNENDLNGNNSVPTKQRRQKQPVVVSNVPAVIDVKQIDNVCNGRRFCILNTASNLPTVGELKRMVLQHGGKVVANPHTDTYVCVAATESLRVKSWKQTGKYNIATVAWLVKALQSQHPLERLIPLSPNDMIFSTDALKQQFRTDFDEFGDSYDEPLDCDDARGIIDGIEDKDLPSFSNDQLGALERKLNVQLINFFRPFSAYFYSSTGIISPDLDMAKLLFLSKGGQCVAGHHNQIEISSLTHIFVDTNADKEFREDLANFLVAAEAGSIVVLDCVWIIKCHQENIRICDSEYVLMKN